MFSTEVEEVEQFVGDAEVGCSDDDDDDDDDDDGGGVEVGAMFDGDHGDDDDAHVDNDGNVHGGER